MNINNDGTASRGRFFYAVHRDDKQAGNKKMPEKDPTNWSAAMWLLASGSAIAGGIVSWYQKMKARNGSFKLCEFGIETAISGFIGVGVFMTAAAAGAEAGICAALAGMGGKMSTGLLTLIEDVIKSKIRSKKNG